MVVVPKARKTYCPYKACRRHTLHKVFQYKKGKESKKVQGRRRYDRKQSGTAPQLFRLWWADQTRLQEEGQDNQEAHSQTRVHRLQEEACDSGRQVQDCGADGDSPDQKQEHR